jgi:hypothetical protein
VNGLGRDSAFLDWPDPIGRWLTRLLAAARRNGPPPKPGSSFVPIVTPSGKVGYVPDDAIGALDSDQLCFVKDAAGWKIAGYAGGDN